MEMGFLQHNLTLIPGRGQTTEMMRKIGWNLREEAKSLPPVDECPTLYHSLIMNITIWNYRGALKLSFQKHVRDLVRNHDPAILIVMETRIGGDRAAKITEKLPFDGAIHTDTIRYVGTLWVLWNSDKVEVASLTKTEQEIPVSIKVCNSTSSWLLSAVYASPRSAKRHILWNNLSQVADMHNLPWIIAGDFNEPLVNEDKFGGRPVIINRSLLLKECLDKCNMVDLGFSGPRYTWTNRRDIQGLIQERIDRFFVNYR